MTDLRDWFNSIPLVTRYWFGASVIIPLLGRFGLLNAMWMYLDWELFFYKFHFWRPFTALVFYPVTPMTGFHWLLMLYFLYNYSKSTEEGTFSGRPADYLFMLIVNWLICTGLCMAIGIPFLLEPMVLSVLYVWCQLNKDTIVSFWFGTRFKAMYLPWILWGFNMVLRGGGINELLGILVGHTYYFLAFRYPQEHGGGMFLVTPQFLRNWLPNEVGGVHGFGQSTVDARRRAQAAGGGRDGHNWGAGHQLGGN